MPSAYTVSFGTWIPVNPCAESPTPQPVPEATITASDIMRVYETLTTVEEERVSVKKTTTKKITSATPTNICPSCLKEMVEIDFDGFSHECECGTLRCVNGTILSAAA